MRTEDWLKIGFNFEKRFPNEYDLWVHPETMQKLRRYCDGREWLTDRTTGAYKPVVEDIAGILFEEGDGNMSNCKHLIAHWEGWDEGGVMEEVLCSADVRMVEEWFKYCPRCGVKLPERNKKGEVVG